MTLEDIPADQKLIMTDVMERLFLYADCKPKCHCCHTEIAVGDIFKLAMVKDEWYPDMEPTDEMLCSDCTVPMLLHGRRKARRLEEEARKGGYSRPHLEK